VEQVGLISVAQTRMNTVDDHVDRGASPSSSAIVGEDVTVEGAIASTERRCARELAEGGTSAE